MHLTPNDDHDITVHSNNKEVEMNSIIPELLKAHARALTFSGRSLLKIHNQPQLPMSRSDAISQLLIMDGPTDLVDNGHLDINDWIPAIHILLFVLIKMESNRIYNSTNELDCLQQLEILVNVPISKIRLAYT
jgi:hypothetical protein